MVMMVLSTGTLPRSKGPLVEQGLALFSIATTTACPREQGTLRDMIAGLIEIKNCRLKMLHCKLSVMLFVRYLDKRVGRIRLRQADLLWDCPPFACRVLPLLKQDVKKSLY